MPARKAERGALSFPKLALGTMNFGSDWMGTGAVGEKRARELLALASDRGARAFLDFQRAKRRGTR